MDILIVGAGEIAYEHARVLLALGKSVKIVGQGQKNVDSLRERLNVEVFSGGIELFLATQDNLSLEAVVAVPVTALKKVTLKLLEHGIKRILVEKPAGLDDLEIAEVSKAAANYNAEIFVSYNRRFYASTLKALEIIKQDGGVSSFCFEFTEWAHVIQDFETETIIKNNWLLANSTHVIDLAFFLGGFPQQISCYKTGQLSWHPNASQYAGAGVTKSGALFSYNANWDAPGRWGVEILTKNSRLIFRPLEKLQIQKIGSVAIHFVDILDDLDLQFKPGFYKQMEAFIGSANSNLLKSIAEQHRDMETIYLKMN